MKARFTRVLCLVLIGVMCAACAPTYREEIPAGPMPSHSEPATHPVPPVLSGESVQADKATMDTLQELIDYLNRQREQDIWVNTFGYPTTLSEQELELLSQSVGAMYVIYSRLGDEHTIELTPYPGDRIAKAHFTGDVSGLSADEIQALRIAEQLVAQAKEQTSDPLELELILYDMFRERTTYQSGTLEITDRNNPPRHLTAVGALVDGRANCQGCADGFYTLATIAGLRMDRMSTRLDGEPHQVNTIYLDGAWYVVDATAPLAEDKGGLLPYPYFNAGLDMCGSLSWLPEEEHRPIASVSDRNYYYNIQNDTERHNYQKTYTELSELAKSAVNAFFESGREVQHLMLVGQVVTQAELGAAIRSAGQELNRGFSVAYGQVACGTNTCITIRFSV